MMSNFMSEPVFSLHFSTNLLLLYFIKMSTLGDLKFKIHFKNLSHREFEKFLRISLEESGTPFIRTLSCWKSIHNVQRSLSCSSLSSSLCGSCSHMLFRSEDLHILQYIWCFMTYKASETQGDDRCYFTDGENAVQRAHVQSPGSLHHSGWEPA